MSAALIKVLFDVVFLSFQESFEFSVLDVEKRIVWIRIESYRKERNYMVRTEMDSRILPSSYQIASNALNSGLNGTVECCCEIVALMYRNRVTILLTHFFLQLGSLKNKNQPLLLLTIEVL